MGPACYARREQGSLIKAVTEEDPMRKIPLGKSRLKRENIRRQWNRNFNRHG